MTLAEWIARYNSDHGQGAVSWLSKKTELPDGTIRRWLKGTRKPKPETWQKLVDATHGEISREAIYEYLGKAA